MTGDQDTKTRQAADIKEFVSSGVDGKLPKKWHRLGGQKMMPELS